MKINRKQSAFIIPALLLGASSWSFGQDTGDGIDPGNIAAQFPWGDSPSADGQSNPYSIKAESSIEKPEDVGKNAHTPLRILVPPGGFAKFNADIAASVTPFGKPPFTGYYYETPASLACVYKLVTPVAGCNPQTFTTNATGGSKAIAIVDAFNYPTAVADLQKFSTQFGLLTPNLTVVYSNGTPPTDQGWSLEAALDVQWAHAMAPSAKLYLVLALDNSFTELFKAVDKASALVVAAGGGEVSMSWGSSEFSTETSLEASHFKTAKVVYVASSGDGPGTLWPAVSANVIGVGGTTLNRAATKTGTGNFLQESIWEDTGGGPSKYVARPSYQNATAVAAKVGTQRGSPDTSLVADPITGGWVYNSTIDPSNPWWIVGGTSWSAPAFTGIINNAGHFAASSAAELTTIYKSLGVAANYQDIKNGFCGPYGGYVGTQTTGWDFCTGVGSSRGKTGK